MRKTKRAARAARVLKQLGEVRQNNNVKSSHWWISWQRDHATVIFDSLHLIQRHAHRFDYNVLRHTVDCEKDGIIAK